MRRAVRLLHVSPDVVRHFLSTAHLPSVVALLGFAATAVTPGDFNGPVEAAEGPYEIFVTGFEDPSGLAVEPNGALLVTDQRAGTLIRISIDGSRHTILDDLHAPQGVAAGKAGIFVLDGGSRVLRVEVDGRTSVVSTSAKQAIAIAAGADGRVWLATRTDRASECELSELHPSGALTAVASGLVDLRAMAVDRVGIYVAVESLAGEVGNHTTLARLSWQSDGQPGPVESLLKDTPRQPHGVAIDFAGDVFLAGSTVERADRNSGVIVKRRGGEIFSVAAGLSSPRASAFGPAGDLFVIDKGGPARILRFRPPIPPTADWPGFTNQNPLGIAGTAQPGSLVQLFSDTTGGRPLAGVVADDYSGAFVVSAPLVSNDRTQLTLRATAGGGSGLLGPPTAASIVHDDRLPAVQIMEPAAAVHVANNLPVRAQATDDGSGLAVLRVTVGQFDEPTVPSDPSGLTLSLITTFDTTRLPEGAHSLSAVAIDRAGNWGGAAQLVVVDRTAPETAVLTGPPAESPDRDVTFTYGGFDVLSPDLEFAWRLDAGAWSPFTRSTSVRLSGIAAGSHRFEVVARDAAGNIDPTPAGQIFAVTTLRVRIVEPPSGTSVTSQTVWVRGTVEGAQDVGLRTPLPALLREELAFDALPVPIEGGTFAVEVPMLPGANSVMIIGRDPTGVERSDSVVINAIAPLTPSPRLEAYPQAGLAPLAVRFAASDFPQGSLYSLDLESDGFVDYTGTAMPIQEFVYSRPGIHVAALTVTAFDGGQAKARTAIEVYDRGTFESRLGALWAGFKAALRTGDVAGAASLVHSDRRTAWSDYFARLTPAQLAATDEMFTEITLREVAHGRADCDMMRDEDGLRYSFPVSFELDVDGAWRLWQF